MTNQGGVSPGLGTPSATPAHSAPALSTAAYAAALSAEARYTTREFASSAMPAKDPVSDLPTPRTITPLVSPIVMERKGKFSIDTADFFAIAFLLLCIGAVISGTIITLGMVYEKFDTTVGSALVGGFYGSPLLLGIIKAVLGEKKKGQTS